MKNTILCGALVTLICTQVQAEVTQPPTQSQTPDSSTSVPSDKTGQNPPTNQVMPTPTPTQGSQQIPSVQAQPAQAINCDYKIPAETKTIEQSLVTSWSEKATIQAFDFNPASLDSQIQKLQTCFTEQGWTGFNSALQKSGNLEAIKTQKLTVSSQVDGQIQVTEAKDNQWKMTLPLQVVYQNDKEKVTQLLSINLTVGRKINGDLGIMQMIATPRVHVDAQQPTGSNTPTNPAATTTPADTGTPTTPASTGTPTVPANTDSPATDTSPHQQTPSSDSNSTMPNSPN